MKLTNIVLFALIAFIAVDQWQDFQEAREQEEYRAFLQDMKQKLATNKQTARSYRPPVGIYWDEEDTHSERDTLIMDLTRQQQLDDIEDRLFMIELFND